MGGRSATTSAARRRGVALDDDKIDTMLISVDELTEAMLSDRPPVILDVRWQLGDTRGHEHYRDGHIPGAVSAPTAANLGPDGRFLSPDDLRQRFAELGISAEDEVIAYCGSGVNAAHAVAALHLAGLSGTMFPGSWSQWSADPSRPAETG